MAPGYDRPNHQGVLHRVRRKCMFCHNAYPNVVGLSALIDKIVSDRRYRPETMPGLDQYVKSIVRRCRVSGAVTGDRITSTNISC